MEYLRTFKWPSIYRVACPMYFETFFSPSFLKQEMHEKPQIKIFCFQNGKHGCLMQYLIRQSFEGYGCESEYILFLFLIF